METRIIERPAFRLVGHATRAPLTRHGTNRRVQAHIEALAEVERTRLRSLADTEPVGLLQVSADVDPDDADGSEFTFLYGVARLAATPAPDGLDELEVSAGTWAVFRTSMSYPSTWATIVREWFPSNPWAFRPGPEMLLASEPADASRTAAHELWLPVEPARACLGSPEGRLVSATNAARVPPARGTDQNGVAE